MNDNTMSPIAFLIVKKGTKSNVEIGKQAIKASSIWVQTGTMYASIVLDNKESWDYCSSEGKQTVKVKFDLEAFKSKFYNFRELFVQWVLNDFKTETFEFDEEKFLVTCQKFQNLEQKLKLHETEGGLKVMKMDNDVLFIAPTTKNSALHQAFSEILKK